ERAGTEGLRPGERIFVGAGSRSDARGLPRGAACMSRLLMLLPSVTTPLDSGAKIRNQGLLNLLSAAHEVDAIAFGAAESIPDLGKLARRTLVVPLPRGRSGASRAADMASTKLPDMALRLWSPEFRRAVQCFVREDAYDA